MAPVVKRAGPGLGSPPPYLCCVKVWRGIKEWIFYGHVWISLAAAGLGWMSLALFSPVDVVIFDAVQEDVLSFLFTATFGVYTLHRLISFRKAGVIPKTTRYALVARAPLRALIIGVVSLASAVFIIWPYLPGIWVPLGIALPLTAFYLVPPLPGWRRLRDVPYLKVVWVAIAWTAMTHVVPIMLVQGHFIGACGGLFAEVDRFGLAVTETCTRFMFILTVALLFDGRDVTLDLNNQVRTVANSHPRLLRTLCPALLLSCAILTYLVCNAQPHGGGWRDLYAISIASTYLAGLPVARASYDNRNEDWYAIVVNGLLLLPPLTCFAWFYFGAGPFPRY